MTRVIVVGGGIAGYCAALGARREGAEVTVLAKAPGASALYAGGMEVVDDLELLLRTEPHHPFTRLGFDALRLATELDTAIQSLQLALEKDGMKLEGTWRTRGRYADIHGVARPANIVPASVARGELAALGGRRVAVVGVPEVGDYDAESTAQALKEIHGVDAFAAEVQVSGLPQSAALTDLFGLPAPQVKARGAIIAYPPGFTDLPADSFEMLAAPPSPHGWRLQQSLGRGATRAQVTGFSAAPGRLISVKAGGKEYPADAFVLATGRFIGGGLEKERVAREPLLGLAVFHDGQPAYGTLLHHLEYLSPAAAFRSGLRTNSRLNPLDREGQPPHPNLFAAGSLLGGYDYGGPCGFGVPILTGWLAGRFAAKWANPATTTR